MTDPTARAREIRDRLYLLADWFDLPAHRGDSDEVQCDLRAWGDYTLAAEQRAEALQAELTAILDRDAGLSYYRRRADDFGRIAEAERTAHKEAEQRAEVAERKVAFYDEWNNAPDECLNPNHAGFEQERTARQRAEGELQEMLGDFAKALGLPDSLVVDAGMGEVSPGYRHVLDAVKSERTARERAEAVASATLHFEDHCAANEDCGCADGEHCEEGVELCGQIADASKVYRAALRGGEAKTALGKENR